jgi:hypothetical protein
VQPTLFDRLETGADFSPCRAYRYRLWRRWSDGPALNVIGLNPSTADEATDDPTIQRLTHRAREWGYPGLVMTNLFALRSTDPRALKVAAGPFGPQNDAAILSAARSAGKSAGARGLCCGGTSDRADPALRVEGLPGWNPQPPAVPAILAIAGPVALKGGDAGTRLHPNGATRGRFPLPRSRPLFYATAFASHPIVSRVGRGHFGAAPSRCGAGDKQDRVIFYDRASPRQRGRAAFLRVPPLPHLAVYWVVEIPPLPAPPNPPAVPPEAVKEVVEEPVSRPPPHLSAAFTAAHPPNTALRARRFAARVRSIAATAAERASGVGGGGGRGGEGPGDQPALGRKTLRALPASS